MMMIIYLIISTQSYDSCLAILLHLLHNLASSDEVTNDTTLPDIKIKSFNKLDIVKMIFSDEASKKININN